jgi:hypothetical protein
MEETIETKGFHDVKGRGGMPAEQPDIGVRKQMGGLDCGAGFRVFGVFLGR